MHKKSARTYWLGRLAIPIPAPAWVETMVVCERGRVKNEEGDGKKGVCMLGREWVDDKGVMERKRMKGKG